MSDKSPFDMLNAFVSDEKHIAQAKSLMQFYEKSMANPFDFWKNAMNMGMSIAKSATGADPIEAERGDKRFNDPIWESNPAYRALKHGFLSWRNEMGNWVDELDLNPRDQERAKLLLITIADTMAPTNSLAGNPAAMNKTLETGGENLVAGFKNFVSDMKDNNGMPSMVDKSKFKVGENVATTPGKVVYREPHLELIQYTPATDEVDKTPIFLVPPQINKFYVYDLAPGRSFIEYLVSQGKQVFVVSWFNPTAKQKDWDLNSYIAAMDRASEAVCSISGSKQLQVIGACSGGISLSALLGYWAANGIDRARSTTLLVTILDTDGSANTSMGLMTSLETLELARSASKRKGVLEGRDLAKIFAWLRPNELIWSYWVNNYLMGQDPPVFDVLFWNADTTSLTAALHRDFIDVLAQNAFTKAGALVVNDAPIDLSKVTCDALIIGGSTDHITPWDGCYRSMHMLGGKNEFILSSSGHVQSIVNPPGNKKSKFQTNTGKHSTPEGFLEDATSHDGTWWVYLVDWLTARSDGMKKAPKSMGNKAYPPLDAAPGTYIKIQDNAK